MENICDIGFPRKYYEMRKKVNHRVLCYSMLERTKSKLLLMGDILVNSMNCDCGDVIDMLDHTTSTDACDRSEWKSTYVRMVNLRYFLNSF